MDPADLDEVPASVRRFVRERVVPAEQEIEDTDDVPVAIRGAAKDMGLYGFAIARVSRTASS
jgi:acyl-CoA dehydrogenase